ncbi:MAG: winged helix-turn-helix domain-containing protein [Acidobacteria bacterium]|nr:winged helix-turn-helix domain-containing protein [Acidobacteriota bacterium]
MNLRKIWVGDWLVIESEQRIVRGDENTKAEPLLISLLLRLAEQPGQVVSKEALTHDVWACEFVTDQVMAVAVYNLRKILGDNAKEPQFIQTLPRRGYRLIAPVRYFEEPPEFAENPLDLDETQNQTPIPEQTQKRRKAWILALAACLLVAALSPLLPRVLAAKNSTHPVHPPSMALLPIHPSFDPQNPLGPALYTVIQGELEKMPDIQLVGAQSLIKMPEPLPSLNELGQMLGVNQLLRVQLDKRNSELYCKAEMLEPQSGTLLWKREFHSGEMSELHFQRHVAFSICSVFDPNYKSPNYQAEMDPQTYRDFLAVAYDMQQPAMERIAKLESFLAENENFFMLRMELVSAYLFAGIYGQLPRDEAYYHSRQHLEKIREMEPQSSSVLMMAGSFALFFDWNIAEAKMLFEKAQTKESVGYCFFGHIELEALLGNFDEASRLLAQARMREPLVTEWDTLDFYLSFYELDTPAAFQKLDKLRAKLNEATILFREYPLYRENQDQAQMRRIENRLLELNENSPEIIAQHKTLSGSQAAHFCFNEILKTDQEAAEKGYYPPVQMAVVAAYAGNDDDVFRYLQEALLKKDPRLIMAPLYPAFKPYRNNPKFHEVRAKLGLTALPEEIAVNEPQAKEEK